MCDLCSATHPLAACVYPVECQDLEREQHRVGMSQRGEMVDSAQLVNASQLTGKR